MCQKLIAIIGATATGKSKLAVQIANILESEIISCDSMQVYKTIDIASAKVPEKEQCGIKHHLLSVVKPDETFNVIDYQKMAKKSINEVAEKGKIPIFAGGTFYYLQPFIFTDFMNQSTLKSKVDFSLIKNAFDCNDEKYSYEKLKEVDPVMAKKVHKNDRRRIITSLNVFYEHGVPHSSLIEANNTSQKLNPNFDFLLLWLDCEKNVLDERISDRVEEMGEKGLLKEICRVRLELEGKEGVFNVTQAIGYTQFEAFFGGLFEAVGKSFFGEEREKMCFLILDGLSDKRLWGGDLAMRRRKIEKVFQNFDCLESVEKGLLSQLIGSFLEGVEKTKIKTRQYVRRQLVWIKNRFLIEESIKIYRFDSTDAKDWEEKVLTPAKDIIKDFIENNPMEKHSSFSATLKTKEKEEAMKYKVELSEWEKFSCEKCKVELNGKREWDFHLKTKNHKRFSKNK